MTASAAQIAAALRHNRPELTPGKVHKLLYLAQGHHLAWYGQPLFADPISMWDTGVIVATIRGTELDGPAGTSGLSERVRNTVGYICSRYGKLHLHDLTLLTTHSTPAVVAGRERRPGTAVTIGHDAMGAYFQTVDVDPDAPIITAAQIAAHLDGADERRRQPAKRDDPAKFLEMAAELRAQAAAHSA